MDGTGFRSRKGNSRLCLWLWNGYTARQPPYPGPPEEVTTEPGPQRPQAKNETGLLGLSPRGVTLFHIPSIASPPWGLTSEMSFSGSALGNQAPSLLESASVPSSSGSPFSTISTSAGSSFEFFPETLKTYFVCIVCIHYPGVLQALLSPPISQPASIFLWAFSSSPALVRIKPVHPGNPALLLSEARPL